MQFSQLIEDFSFHKKELGSNPEITGLSFDSRTVEKGDLFFAIQGKNVDGADYIRQAIQRGAVAVIAKEKPKEDVPYALTDCVRKGMAHVAAKFYDNAHKKLKLVAVTGTNGKTTVARTIHYALNLNGKRAGVIGTTGVYYADKYFAPILTTPDSLFLHRIFADMVKNNVEYVVMEVSAHALKFDRVHGLTFAVSILTNLSQDHLDDFLNMESYAKAKAKLFTPEFTEFAIFNTDDDFALALSRESTIPHLTYGLHNPSDAFAIDVKFSPKGTEYVMNLLDYVYRMQTTQIGEYNVSNQLAAALALLKLGIPTRNVAAALCSNFAVEGRMERVAEVLGASVYVDFAHTPEGLKNALTALRAITKGKLICLFGCGGNRDMDKRAKMGEISGALADFTIITSDNPRYEDPLMIIGEVERGVRKQSKRYVTVQDRRMGISYALEILSKGDVLLLAGKGAENYQEIMGVRFPYSDKEYVKELLS
ncbi:MAG: UDP-N-acetylmuramoyl-L-alanyl-D-glutamate--2,6-diaminopimelate ligase [Clostridiales bacterium]|nr:UDP-N-acetylmuramoyl-L-alanyl-D-glutamate--2,6-diaminopimelate ligase [Clostridiales bacterium]